MDAKAAEMYEYNVVAESSTHCVCQGKRKGRPVIAIFESRVDIEGRPFWHQTFWTDSDNAEALLQAVRGLTPNKGA